MGCVFSLRVNQGTWFCQGGYNIVNNIVQITQYGLDEAKELVGVGGTILGFKLRRLMATWREVSEFFV